jgi:protein phosphatase
MLLDYIYFTNIGLKRTVNEDSVNVYQLNDGLLAIVCDGLGGNRAGNIASKLAVDTIHAYFVNSSEEDNLIKIDSAITEANTTLIKTAESNEALRGMATTVETLYIDDVKAYWGHVGDSRIYLYVDNNLSQLTKDHSLVQKLVDDGVITEEIASKHPYKNVIMRAIGDKNEVVVDFDYLFLKIEEPWKFFMCTDGVSNVVSDEELSSLLSNNDLNYISVEMTKLIESRGAPDNFSFIIINNKV